MSSNKVLDRGSGYSRRVTQYGFETVNFCVCILFVYLFTYLSVSRLLLACFLYLHLSLLYSQSFMLLLFCLLRKGCYVSTATSPPVGESGEGFSLLQSVQTSSVAHPTLIQ